MKEDSCVWVSAVSVAFPVSLVPLCCFGVVCAVFGPRRAILGFFEVKESSCVYVVFDAVPAKAFLFLALFELFSSPLCVLCQSVVLF